MLFNGYVKTTPLINGLSLKANCCWMGRQVRHASNKIYQGDIYRMGLSLFSYDGGHVEKSKGGRRPAIVVTGNKTLQNEENNKVILARIKDSSKGKNEAFWEVKIDATGQSGLSKPSKALANQLFSVRKDDLKEKVGAASQEEVDALKVAIHDQLGIIEIPLERLLNRKGKLKVDAIIQGDIVEIVKEGVLNGRKGIVMSHNVANIFSEVAMMSHVSQEKEEGKEYDVVIISDGETSSISCNTINAISTQFLKKIGHVDIEDFLKLRKKLYEVIEIE